MALAAAPGATLESLVELHGAALGEEERLVLVAKRDGLLVAMAHIVPSGAANAPHRAEVQRVVVAASERGSSVGRRLMARWRRRRSTVT